MKIEIDVNENYDDMKVRIECPNLTPDVEKVLSVLRMMDMQIAARKGDEMHILDAAGVLYVEAVDRETFLYTQGNVYESELKLYELENQLGSKGFFRVSKSCIINLKKIKSLKAEINRRILVTMVNGEQIIVSRMYADELRKRLGVK